jgi:undecaprenyl diphosphate synthase
MQELLSALSPNDPDWALAQSIDPQRLPRHIAIIMDGNGRWAKKRHLPRVAGHKAGVAPVRMAAETCARMGIESLTLYAFSTENWKRPRTEIDTLWALLNYYLRLELNTLMKNDIRLAALGRIESLPEEARRELASVIEASSSNRRMRLNLAINYSGRADIVDAANRLLSDARASGDLNRLTITEESLSAKLSTGDLPDPDLLIRTSGEMRVSNFLLWQIAYAELYVTDTLWPDFNRAELLRAIIDYQKRDRRFGGIGADGKDAAVPDEVPVPAP